MYFLVEFEYHQLQNQVLLAYNTETITPNYGLLNVSVGTDVVNALRNTLFSLYLTAQNITDVAYQNHQNRLKYLDRNVVTGRQGVYNIGRNIGVKLMIPLHIK